MVATQLVLPQGKVLKPVDLGAAAGSGYSRIKVAQKPKIGLIPTGTELAYPGEPLEAGDIIEYNSIVLAAQMGEWGAATTRYPNTADDYQKIRKRVLQAARENDLVMLIAGSSAGSEDYSARIVQELGELLVHGVAVRPGHPVILGMIQTKAKITPIVGVPGYPVSAALTTEIFVAPLLDKWLGRVQEGPQEISAKMTRKVNSPAGDDEYLRVAVGYLDDQVLAAPLSRGSGVITSLVRADGIVIIPRGIQGIKAGQEVTVQLYRMPSELKKTIFTIGSHDLSLDLMAQYLTTSDRRLASVNAGSLGGILALKRGEAHLAGAHLLDPETGEFNIAYVKKHLPEIPLRIVTFVGRTQGLFVVKDNPKSISDLSDLSRPDLKFVNRQHGAGTRLLLDYHLEKLGINPEEVVGYDHEEFTHLSAAALIASGRADCALGIEAAAYALDLDFIPLFTERFDLLIPEQYASSELLVPVFNLLDNPKFKQAVAERPGYQVEEMGQVVALFPETK
jgi:putative molybdopterin biosynthesis protein